MAFAYYEYSIIYWSGWNHFVDFPDTDTTTFFKGSDNLYKTLESFTKYITKDLDMVVIQVKGPEDFPDSKENLEQQYPEYFI